MATLTRKTVTCQTDRGIRTFEVQRRVDGNSTYYTVYRVSALKRAKLGVITTLKGHFHAKVSKVLHGSSFPTTSVQAAFHFLVNR